MVSRAFGYQSLGSAIRSTIQGRIDQLKRDDALHEDNGFLKITPKDSKEALGGPQVSKNKELGDQMAKKAIELKNQGRLSDAADLMEEAFEKWSYLRVKYAAQVRLWRCGVSM